MARQFEALVRTARARIERALLIDAEDEDRRKPLLLEAERYARAAAELKPGAADGWFLIAAAVGLRGEYESTRAQVRLGGVVWEMAATALDRDPDHAGAHHVMGRLNLEAMSLSGVARMIATHFYGSEVLRRASWAQAERHLRLAAALEPDQLYHRLWLARLYIERGDDDEARRLLRELLAIQGRTELDRVWREEAARELQAID
ncbi:MAG TPA: tetratricopeptide repeat protein [Longimicrobiales bacterium]